MVALKNRFFLKVCVFFLAVLVVGGCLVKPTSALTDKQENLYRQNSIYFYSSTDCLIGGGSGNNSGGKFEEGDDAWNGSCTGVTFERAQWLKKYIDFIQSVASSNSLPWEMIAAQAFMESGGGTDEVCPYNPLGLKGNPSCDGSHRKFNSYKEAFQYYANRTISVGRVKGKYPNDPYSAVAYIQYGVPHGLSYAQCSKAAYLTDRSHACYGHNLGDPTPGYVQKVSSLICGIQKWAKALGYSISAVNWSNYSSSASSQDNTGDDNDSDENSDEDTDEEDDEDSDKEDDDTDYCIDNNGGSGEEDGDDDDADLDPSSMIFYSQCDSRWKNYMYGSGGINGSDGKTICQAGCGPTSFAVIAANLKGDKGITPAQTSDLAGKAGMYVAGKGSSHGITTYLAGQYGLSAVKIPGTISAIDEYLSKGYMIHTSGKGSPPFTSGGHYIAIVKKLSNGKWLVADSSKRGPSGEYDPAAVMAGMSKDNVWAVK